MMETELIWWCRIVTSTPPKSKTDDVDDNHRLLHFNQTGIPPYLARIIHEGCKKGTFGPEIV
jgi:hypothetical protein